MKLVLFLILLLPITLSAQVYESGNFKVKSMRMGSNALYVQFEPAPNYCQGGSQYRMHVKVNKSQANFSELMSLVLVSYTTGSSFNYLFMSNEGQSCSNTHILDLDMLELKPKA